MKMIKRLLAFLKLHLFEILLLVFCIVMPYTLGRYVSLRGVLASFLFLHLSYFVANPPIWNTNFIFRKKKERILLY